MKRTLIAVLAFSFLALPVSAAPKAGLTLPAKAVEVSNGVFSLGRAYDVKSDSFVEGYAIVHKKNNAKGGNGKGGGKPDNGGGPACYGFIANGAKWKSIENWEVYSGAGLDANFLLSNTGDNIAKWEVAADGTNILGNGSIGNGVVTDPYTLDNINQVSFGDLDEGTIAVTVIWGVWNGPSWRREIVAWDQVFNTDYAWSDHGETDKMDYENISTHELGHSIGLADIYDASCGEVTMYGYGTEGEIKKQTLDQADVDGASSLY